jgi:hypothetical protein
MISVDQLGTDVLRSAWPHLGDDGFRRIEREGVSFTECAYDHACSVTAPGHATLATGASPSVHGIVGNDWADAGAMEVVGSVDDRSTRLVPSGGTGASAHRLLVPTFADTLKAAFGGRAKAATVALKDRSAILMAGASADFVVWFDRKKGLLTTSTAFVPAESGPEVAWLDELNRLRPVESFADYAWPKLGPPGAYAGLVEDDDPVEPFLGGSRTLPHHITLAAAPSLAAFCEALVISPAGSDIVWAAAGFLLEKGGLGKDDIPDFLGIGFSSNDWVGHAFGPDSHEVRDMTLRTDRIVGEILAHLDRTVGKGRYHVILTADHGVGPVPEVAARRGIAAGRIHPDRVKLAIEAAMRDRFGPAPGAEHWYALTGDAGVLLNRPLLAAKKIPLAEAQDVAAAGAARVRGVAEAIAVHTIADGTLPSNAVHDAIKRAFHGPRYPDVYVVPKPYHLFGSTVASHGTPYQYDRRVPLFLSGPGLKAGHRSHTPVSPGSGVVTIAAVLGIGPPAGADHPVLAEALAE